MSISRTSPTISHEPQITFGWYAPTALALILGITLFQRIAIPIGGFQLPAVIFIVFAVVAFLYWKSAVILSTERVIWFAVTFALLITSTVIADAQGQPFGAVSYRAMIYLFLLYLPFIFVLRSESLSFFPVIVHMYLRVMLIMSGIAIAQFLIQFVGIRIDMLLWDLVPDAIVSQTFNFEILVDHRSNLRKSNGVFFLEPSFLSRALAVAILMELIYTRNFIRLAIFHVAIALSFSGTGLMILMVGYPLVLRYIDGRLLLLSLIVLLPVGVWFLFSEYAYYTLKRVSEFSSTNTSGYARFVAPYKLIVEYRLLNNWFVGYGPGTANDFVNSLGSHTTFFLKTTFEYGVVPTLMLLAFILRCVITSLAPISIGIALIMVYTILSGGTLSVQSIYGIFIFAALATAPRFEHNRQANNGRSMMLHER